MTKAIAVLYLSPPQKTVIYVTEAIFEHADTKRALPTPTACNIMVTQIHTKQKPNTLITQGENVPMLIIFTDLLTYAAN